jgi:thioredoxin-like negative regulator of GroEL
MIELMVQAEQELDLGLVDQAEKIYQQVASADPGNAMAVVGLARVRLERGDQVGAHELALEALLIDPENSAALRMEARLREVLAGAGQAVSAPPPLSPAPAKPGTQESPGELVGTGKPGLVARLLGRSR